MIEAIEFSQIDCLRKKSDFERKKLGQYFTSSAIAHYMASMIKPFNKPIVRMLDAGAGAGILTIAAALRCLEIGNNHVHAVLYEIDEAAIFYLKRNMKQLAVHFQHQHGIFSFEIRHQDFVLSRPDKTEHPFHISLINPPYFKYNTKTSPYSSATSDLFKGNPNIYASFMAVVSQCMAPNGQMMAIVPRSFTNGLYFNGFRHYMQQTMSLDRLHIFRSRNTLFKTLSVLQENIICSYIKDYQSHNITVCTSTSAEDLHQVLVKRYLAKLLIDNTNLHNIIRIPESQQDANILGIVEAWHASFHKNGYFISTGPVVEHRTKEYITLPNHKENSAPLLRMHNVKAFETTWTGKNKKDACFRLCHGHEKHTSINQRYLLLKRFSAKDEKRRLVAGIHEPETITGKYIALENHLNYIGRTNGDLETTEAYGLAALFNSTLMDRYFRCISGNTQVNATEIRLLKLPGVEVIHQIGAAILKSGKTDQKNVDDTVNSHLKIQESWVA